MENELFQEVGSAIFFNHFSSGGQFLMCLGHFKAISRMAIFDLGSEYEFGNSRPCQKAEIWKTKN